MSLEEEAREKWSSPEEEEEEEGEESELKDYCSAFEALSSDY